MSLLNNAIKDYETSKKLYEIMQKDGNNFFLNNICYHLQQCMEKELKYLIELTGIRYERIHDIFELADNCHTVYNKNNFLRNDIVSRLNKELDHIFEKANIYTSWESKTRYYDGFKELNKNVDEAFEICENLMNICKNIENEYR